MITIIRHLYYSGVSRTRRRVPLRAIAAPFVVAPPGGARIRGRLRLSGQDASVLGQVGDHLGRLSRADLAARIRLGDVTRKDNDRTTRKRGITAGSTSRWAGTITVNGDGIVSVALPGPLRHLANAPRGRYQLAAPVTFAHRGGQWADRVAGNLSVRYDITYCPDRDRWYIDASWSIPTAAVDLASLSGRRLLGVDLNAEHLAAHVIDGHGNPTGPPVTVPLDLTGPASQRDGRLRHAITTLIRIAHTTSCTGIAVENLGFADARTVGRETMGRGRRGKQFRRTVAGIPTAKFRDRLTAMAHTAGLAVVAVDAAYTSRWGGQHWRAALRMKTSTASGHHAAAVVIARRAHGYKARRRSGVTRTRPEDRVGKTTDQAMPPPVGVGERSVLIETACTTPVDKTRPASPRPRSSPAPKTARGAPDTHRGQCVGQQRPTH